MRAILIALLISLAGCYRNSPEQQVEDYKTCTDASMNAFLTVVGEIKCEPKQEAASHEQ